MSPNQPRNVQGAPLKTVLASDPTDPHASSVRRIVQVLTEEFGNPHNPESMQILFGVQHLLAAQQGFSPAEMRDINAQIDKHLEAVWYTLITSSD